jgi:cell division protease FtsH
LLRPGRFDRQIELTLPDEGELIEIMRVHLSDDLSGIDLRLAARLGRGATGALVVGWVNAARQRAEAEDRKMTLDDLLAEIAPADGRSEEELRDVAIHESCHAAIAVDIGRTVESIDMIMRPGAGGQTLVRISGGMPSAIDFEHRIMIALSGRAGDELIGRGPTTGAASDLALATKQAAGYLVTFGMGEQLAYRADPEDALGVMRLDRKLTDQVEAMLQRLMQDVRERVAALRPQIEALAELLIERRVLTGEEALQVLRGSAEGRHAGKSEVMTPPPSRWA